MKITLFIFFLSFSLSGHAQLIQGNNQEYAGKKLTFFRYTDPVTQEKEKVFTLMVDQNGNFSTQLNLSQPAFVTCDFGIYRGMLILEKENTINLLLPPFREKLFADQKNPFFNPVEFWFATDQANLLNDQIAAFDAHLNQLTDKHFNSLYFNQSRTTYDSIAVQLEREFGATRSNIFKWHKKLKLKAVEADAFRLTAKNVAEAIREVQPEYWTQPAFMQLLDKSFTNLLSFESRSGTGQDVKKAVASGDLSRLKKITVEKYMGSGSMADLVLLKMLHDAYYSGDFSQNHILKLLASGYFLSDGDKNIRSIAENIQKKLKHLRPGTIAPVVCLKNTDGHLVCSDGNPSGETGKFKYLIFADTEMAVCQEQLKFLTRINELFQKHLDIYIILKKTDLIAMKMFLEKQQIPGIHLIDEKSEFIVNYRIRSFPMCFLLNGNHEVVFQHTLAPLDGFEQQFGHFLRRKLFEDQRNGGAYN